MLHLLNPACFLIYSVFPNAAIPMKTFLKNSLKQPFHRPMLKNTRTPRSLALALGLLSAAMLLPACTTPTAEVEEAPLATPQYEPTPVPEQTVNGEKVAFDAQEAKDLAGYVGETVALSGQVAEIHGDQAFTLSSDASLSPEDPVLVLLPDAEGMAMPTEGTYVQLLGDVRVFSAPALEESYNFTLDPEVRTELEAAYNMQPVVISKE